MTTEETKPITSLTAAQAFARDLMSKGISQIDIGKELARRGWLSNKTKKPLGQAGVSHLLLRRKKQARRADHTKAQSKTKKGGGDPSLRLKLVRSICEQTDMDAEDRLAAISLLLS